MATRTEIEQHYDTVGALHALRLEEEQGGFPDYTCALFDGDFSKSLDQGQEDKHTWIFNGLGLGRDLSGKCVLDIGCGWGPTLNAARKRGGKGIGLTLSPGQVAYCTARGLDARLKDYKDLKDDELTEFDGIISIGAFEHFCSIEELLEGKQEDIYRKFFSICAHRLPMGGRLYLQTMTWGIEVPDPRRFSLDAPANSPEAILARLTYLYPGSWLPSGLEQIVDCAKDTFSFISNKNGRLDYLETLKRWSDSTRNLWKPQVLPRTLWHAVPLAFHILTNRNSWIQWQSIKRGDQTSCFAREIMSHQRIFFEKK